MEHHAAPPPSDEVIDRALAATVADAAVDGIIIEADEQALIRRHQRGDITRQQFLHQAEQLALIKADELRRGRHDA